MATWAVLAGFEFVGLGFVTACLLRHFAVKTAPWVALCSVFISWYLGFFGTLFLPIDIAEGYASRYTNITNVTEVEYINDTIPVINGSLRLLTHNSGYDLVPDRHLGREGLSVSGAAVVLWTAANTWTTSLGRAAQELTYGRLPAVETYSSSAGAVNAVQGLGWPDRRLLSPPRYLQNVGLLANTSSNSTDNDTVVTWEIVENEVQIRNGPLETMWFLVYWTTFLLTYVVLPVVQEFVAAGEFTVKERIKTAIRVNVVFYVVIGVVGAGAFAYVLLGTEFKLMELPPLLISIANTYGLFLIVLLMGYGAAEVPRSIWRKGDPKSELRRLQFQAAETEGVLFDAKTELNETIAQVKQLQSKIIAMGNEPANQTGSEAAAYTELQRCLEIVMTKVNAEANTASRGSSSVNSDLQAVDEKLAKKAAKRGWGKAKVMIKKLAYLHKRFMAAQSKAIKNQFRWDRHVLKAIQLEYIVDKKMPPAPVFQSKAGRSASAYWGSPSKPVLEDSQPDSGMTHVAAQTYAALACFPNLMGGAINRAMWHFDIYFGPITFKTLAIAAEIFSILLMWSEATIWINLQGLVSDNLSVFGHILVAADENNNHEYVGIQVAAAIPLAWMCICSTYSIFRIKLFNILDLSGNRNTDPYSLCVNAALFNRLQFSLAFNYLNVLFHSNNKEDFPDTAFLHSVGAQMKLSVIDWYLPVLMVAVYLVCRVNLFERIMRLLGIDEKGSPQKGNSEHEQMVKDGAKLISSARRRMGLDGEEGAAAPRNGHLDDHAGARRDPETSGGFMSKFTGGSKVATAAPSAGVELPPSKPTASSSRFMSLDNFATGAGNRHAAPAPAPASDFGFTSSAWDSSNAWDAPAPAASSSALKPLSFASTVSATATASVGRASKPNSSLNTSSTRSALPPSFAAPARPGTTKTNMNSFAPQAAAPSSAFSASGISAAPSGTSTSSGPGLAALLKGKKPGYGQLD